VRNRREKFTYILTDLIEGNLEILKFVGGTEESIGGVGRSPLYQIAMYHLFHTLPALLFFSTPFKFWNPTFAHMKK